MPGRGGLPPQYDVFISYSHNDKKWVREWLLPRLEAAGLRVCIDFRDFEVGRASLVNIERAVEHSGKTLLVLTADWVASEWTSFEELLAHTRDPAGVRRRVLPLMLQSCDLPSRLAILTYADFRDERERDVQFERIVAGIKEERGAGPGHRRPGPGLVPLPPEALIAHPYPIQANFTGRKEEREELTAWLQGEGEAMVAMIGMGGWGRRRWRGTGFRRMSSRRGGSPRA